MASKGISYFVSISTTVSLVDASQWQ